MIIHSCLYFLLLLWRLGAERDARSGTGSAAAAAAAAAAVSMLRGVTPGPGRGVWKEPACAHHRHPSAVWACMTSSADFRFSCSGRGYIISISLVRRTYTSKQAVGVVAHVFGGTLLPAPRSFAFTAAWPPTTGDTLASSISTHASHWVLDASARVSAAHV